MMTAEFQELLERVESLEDRVEHLEARQREVEGEESPDGLTRAIRKMREARQ